ncbi:UNVERIFIED_CONTAM: Retrovirus-related Pol polyprotein from transposon [Sesamum indicum]
MKARRHHLADVLIKMGLDNAKLEPIRIPLVGFGGTEIESLGTIDLPVSMGVEPNRKTLMVKFLVVDTLLAYNVILGKPGLNSFIAVVSTYHLKMKFPTKAGVGEVACDQEEARRIGSHLEEPFKTLMVTLLRNNTDIFAWSSSNFRGVDPDVIVHRLNVDPNARPVQQKKRNFSAETNQIVKGEVKRLLQVDYISKIQYTNWLSNVVVVPKPGGKWRVCIDFTDLNKACPKDLYPVPRIDALVDSTAGYELFSMMDAY